MVEYGAALLEVSDEVQAATAQNRPVVAIESVVVTPPGRYPENITLLTEISDAMRGSGVVPALVMLIDGRIVVGPTSKQLERFAKERSVAKVGKRELALALVKGGVAATTVSATLYCARLCGIPIAMTGAIGGVHRKYEETLDVSSDLEEISRTPAAIVCTGAKIILDLARTLEYLETKGVPVVGFRTDNFPAYFCPTQLAIDRLDQPAMIAALMDTHWRLGADSGLIIAVPPPIAMEAAPLEVLVEKATERAQREGISGKALTPYLLRELDEATAGDSEKLRRTAILAVAKAASEIAIAYAARRARDRGAT